MRRLDLSQPIKQFLSNTVLSYVGVLASVVVSVFRADAITAARGVGLAAVLLLVIGITQYYNTYRPLLRYRDKQLSTFLEDYLSTVESEIEVCAADASGVTSCDRHPTVYSVTTTSLSRLSPTQTSTDLTSYSYSSPLDRGV